MRKSLLTFVVSIASGSIPLTVAAQASPSSPQEPNDPATRSADTPKSADAPKTAPSTPQKLEAVTITATRRREPAREVPMQVDTLSTEKLQQSGAKTLTDYLGDQPGVDVKTTGGAGTGAINVRGVSTGDQTISTVGVYIDDVAIGSSSAYAAGATTALDMSLLDLNHIELLRGPQGTLYGAGAMGGLLKYVTNEPDTYEFSGKVSLGGTLTKRGGPGNTQSAVVNIPLKEDVAGLRISAFRDHVGGYVDAVGPASGTRINGGYTVGARVSLLVEPLARLKIRLTATQQDIKRDGADYVDYDVNTGQPVYGGSTRKLSVREPYSVKVKVAAADIEYDFGWARLNSITSTQRTDFAQRSDYSGVYGPAVGLDTVIADLRAKAERTTQEFRLTSQAGGQFEWLAGLYYNREKGSNHQTDTGVTDGDLLFADIPSNYREKAIYGDVTWNATRSISLTGGVRIARNSQDYVVAADGLLVGGPVTFVGDSAETSKTYLLTAKYALTPTSNVYARVASGYRPGGPNPASRDANGNALVPPTFQHDSLWSYEAGYKADLLEKSLSIQAAVYDIRWSQIQQYFAVNGVNVIVNGGRAHIQGAELSATYRPTSQLSIGGGLSYTDARLSEDAPGLALAGSRLPNTPRFSANFSANYGFELGGRAAYVGISQRLVSSRNAGFDGSAALPQYRLPGYGLTDLQAGVDLERFQIALFVRNLFDRRAQIGGETNLVAAGVGGPVMVNEARPFTIGTTLTAKF
jgi:iron complex outermembrane receptor protein